MSICCECGRDHGGDCYYRNPHSGYRTTINSWCRECFERGVARNVREDSARIQEINELNGEDNE